MGSINKDIQVRVDRWPKPGETQQADDLLMLSGGKAANRAYMACKLGVPSVLISRLGDDPEAEEALQPLREMGVNLEHTRRVPGQRTGLAMIAVRPDGDKSILAAGNANQHWEQDAPALVEKVISAAPAGSVLTLDLEIPAFVVRQAIKAARARGFQIVLDPSPTNQVEASYYKAADFITPDRSEAEQLVGFEIKSKEDGFRACEAILQKGAPNALVKMGELGYVMITDGTREHIAAPDAHVVDKTGGGDAFASAFACALLEGKSASGALRFAAAASSLAVEAYGSQPAYPDREAIEKKMAESGAAISR